MSTAKNVLYAIVATLTFVAIMALAFATHPAYAGQIGDRNHQPQPQPAPAKESSNDAALIAGFVLASVGLAIYLDRERKQKVSLQIDRTQNVPIVKFEQRF